MTTYSVRITTRNPKGGDPQAELPGLARLADAIAEHYGVAAGGQDGWDVTLSVEGDSAFAAGSLARDTVLKAVHDVDIAAWPVVRIEAVDQDELARDLARPQLPDLVSGPEAGDILEVTRQRLHQLREQPDFPRPLIERPGAVLWVRQAIEAFGETRSRKPGRPKAQSRHANDNAPAVDSATAHVTPAEEMKLINKRIDRTIRNIKTGDVPAKKVVSAGSDEVTKGRPIELDDKGDPRRRRARRKA